MCNGVHCREYEPGNAHADVELLTEIPVDESTNDIIPAQESRKVPTHAQQHEEEGRIQGASCQFGKPNSKSVCVAVFLAQKVLEALPKAETKLQRYDECHEEDRWTVDGPVCADATAHRQFLLLLLVTLVLLIAIRLLLTGYPQLLDARHEVLLADLRVAFRQKLAEEGM